MTLIQKEPQSIKIGVEKSLCFTANTAGSTVRLNKYGSPTNTHFETSTDGITWSDYTVSTRITLTNIGDKVYFRNKSGTTYFSIDGSNYYYFQMTGSIAASGDVTSLLNKNFKTSADASDLFRSLFRNCASLTTAPSLPLTTLGNNCYVGMFNNCTGLTTLPELPATTLTTNCYSSMFSGCTNIKLSTTQTGDYQTAYRIPSSGTGTTGTNSLNVMFLSTGGTFTGTPTINQTYYTSNTVVPSTTSPVKDIKKVYLGSTQVRPKPMPAGIYHNATLGLISLSSDGSTWLTIADKNLGATQVYNSGDTLSEANCGKFYQWGNNYGFPFTGATTTSSTQVNAQNYGPGNYYSSSTFIEGANFQASRDSSTNKNLWGGKTGTVEAMRGPCDSGYHVMSADESNTLLSTWASIRGVTPETTSYGYRITNSTDVYNFLSDLKLPLGGDISWTGNKGTSHGVWTSTYTTNSRYAWIMVLGATITTKSNSSSTPEGRSIRPFKNEAVQPDDSRTKLY